ncbi:hypothetical protein CEXT_182841 [Caerostris extrusa]|uniref:Uncharacterized protein n=1 Tax=Caerostris extrusa TaxID=172846 RepID=A0AAV4RRC4_CAEEX|nr:hypothetical protein CEXT_182841 [Caerostris extrusa]
MILTSRRQSIFVQIHSIIFSFDSPGDKSIFSSVVLPPWSRKVIDRCDALPLSSPFDVIPHELLKEPGRSTNMCELISNITFVTSCKLEEKHWTLKEYPFALIFKESLKMIKEAFQASQKTKDLEWPNKSEAIDFPQWCEDCGEKERTSFSWYSTIGGQLLRRWFIGKYVNHRKVTN